MSPCGQFLEGFEVSALNHFLAWRNLQGLRAEFAVSDHPARASVDPVPGPILRSRIGLGQESQNREPESSTSARAQLATRSRSTAASERPCRARACTTPYSDQPLWGWSASSVR